MNNLASKIRYASAFCISRAGTGNRESTRALASCVECDEASQVMAALVRRAHKNPKLEAGIRLIFVLESLNEAAVKHGVAPLRVL